MQGTNLDSTLAYSKIGGIVMPVSGKAYRRVASNSSALGGTLDEKF